MIIDARRIPHGTKLECDVLVVGTGPAGIPLALHLAQSGADIIVLEAGGERFSQAEQKHFSGEVVDALTHHPLDRYRLRQFGGTSNLWGGRCAPYDDIDFEQRPWVPFSGWPFSNKEIRPLYKLASEYLDTGEFSYDVRDCLVPGAVALFPGMIWDKVSDRTVWRYSLPTKLGQKYRDRLERLANVRVLLHASCLELQTSTDGTRVRALT